ncbi:MAG: phosphosulfolactate synthase [Candidatus Azotimanducaceae bacterium]|jgi:phosphosulfolactate synthase
MMNFDLPYLPIRDKKPREKGVTMMMDKGLSLSQAANFAEVASEYTDIVKLGFGTAVITPNLVEKIKLYKDAGMRSYFGGTLFEAFEVRGMFDDYRRLLDKYGMDMVEVSDGTAEIPTDKKCEYISTLAKDFTVLSEVGSKDSEKLIAPYRWIEMMEHELQAGAWKVIAEAREGGNVGIFQKSGEVRSDLIEEILTKIDRGSILWEAPLKSQQVWFLKLIGSDVNLGNIAYDEVIPLECLRLGLRGDTFFDSLPSEFIK